MMAPENKTVSNRRPALEVADIFRLYGPAFRKDHRMPIHHLNVMHRIEHCRTKEMGGHVDQCDNCDFRQNAYNSCGDRHCPKCRGMNKEQWINDRKSELLPVGYFHIVFTLPHDLNPIILCNMKIMLDMLFQSVNEVLQSFSQDPQWRLEGRLGFINVLHTWSQTLMDHFHLHCLIPGGVITKETNKWKPAGKKFLFRTESLAKDFRRRYLEKLKRAYVCRRLLFPGKTAELSSEASFYKLIRKLYTVKWMVYAKRPFAGPEQVLEYLGRYTHRVAISNHRIISIDNDQVTFTYKDRQDDNKHKAMTLTGEEFIRRFLLHILPKRFVKIRYFGFLFHRVKKRMIEMIRNQIAPDVVYPESVKETVRAIMLRLTGIDITRCPRCGKGRMRHCEKIDKRPWFASAPDICWN